MTASETHRANPLTADEQWVLDRVAAANSSLSPKVILGLWQSTFPNKGLPALRTAVASLKQKQLITTGPNGELSLVEEPRA